MTVEQLLASLGARELQEWQLIARIEAREEKEKAEEDRVAAGAEAARRGAAGGRG